MAFQRYVPMHVYKCPMEHMVTRPVIDNPQQKIPCGTCRHVHSVAVKQGKAYIPPENVMMVLQPGTRRVPARG